jgi:predicted nucleic acid-binding protein
MFDDEDHVAAARSILWGYQSGTVSLLAPDHLHHEVLNALRTAVRMERVTAELAEASAADFLDLNIPTAGSPRLYPAGLRTALAFGCAFYDGLYVSLANEAGCGCSRGSKA